MANSKSPVNIHTYYHAHVYFDQESLSQAIELCELAGQLFNVKIGRVHQKLVGPHPKWSCQISFNSNEFEALISWLDQQRNGMSILVHGVTGDNLTDHTEYAYWLGASVELNLAMFRET